MSRFQEVLRAVFCGVSDSENGEKVGREIAITEFMEDLIGDAVMCRYFGDYTVRSVLEDLISGKTKMKDPVCRVAVIWFCVCRGWVPFSDGVEVSKEIKQGLIRR